MPEWRGILFWIALNGLIQVIADMKVREGIVDIGRMLADTTLILATWCWLRLLTRRGA